MWRLVLLLQLPGTLALSLSSSATPSAACRLGPASLATLRTAGYVVVDDFAPPAVIDALNRDIDSLRGEGRFAVAGVGEASTNRVDNR